LVKGVEDRLHIDLYSLAQTIYCFFPNRISFHKNQDGKVVLKQELMATTNGIDPGDAHAAVDDVKTLLKLAKLMEEKVPEVFYSALASGNKKRVIELLSKNLFLNYGEVKYKERIAVKRTPTFICQDPSYANNLVLFDLSFEPEDYLYMTPEEIASILNKKGSPFFNIKANRSPVLLPGNLCELNGLSFEEASLRANKIQENIGFKESVVVACDINSKKRSPWESPDYPESQIYSKFIDSHDKLLSKAFLESESTEDKINIIHQMNDGRLIDFAKRLLASENENCDPVIQMNYQEFEAKRLLSDDDVPWRTLNGARKSIENVEKRMTVNEAIMSATKTYYDIVEKELRK
jgi:exonuclease I